MSLKKPLTTSQRDIYSKLREYIEKNSFSPTLDELRKIVGAGSINTVVQHLDTLEEKGYIIRRKHVKRNIEIRKENLSDTNASVVNIPVVASVGCDDLSVFANEQHDEFIEVGEKILKNRGSVVAVRAIGDSMSDADIHNGDYVLIELTNIAKNGDRVAAIVGDMVTVKKIERKNGLTILRPESKDPKYKPIILSEDFIIAGKVICTVPSDSMDITDVVYE